MQKVLKEIRKLHFHEHRALPTILTVSVAHCEEVLMVCLANVWRKYKVVLILLVDVVNAESFARRVCESCDHVVFNYWQTFLRLVFLNFEWVFFVILYSIVVVDPLIGKRRRLRYARYQTLYWACHRVIIH